MTKLPLSFLTTPIAHRALHDAKNRRPENSMSAIAQAIAHGYGIELDLQLSKDGRAMVFHDHTLDRVTTDTGPINAHTSEALAKVTLKNSDDTIPTLAAVLKTVEGRVPILLEIKDQDGALGPNVGDLEKATAHDLKDYDGPIAVMSFNPNAVAAFAQHAPTCPVGLTTGGFAGSEWSAIAADRRAALDRIADFDQVGACFVSHDADDLGNPSLHELKDRGVPILCWTIRSQAEEDAARRVADNVTFEGYLAKLS